MSRPARPDRLPSARSDRGAWARVARRARVLLGAAAAALAGPAAAQEPLRIAVIGGLAGVSQYTQLEQPFWEREIPVRSGGRLTATIRSSDAGGLRGGDMLHLIRLGVVPFGTALLAVAAGDEPELNAVDLPALNPDIATLRLTVERYREHLRSVLHARYGIELLGVYAYPAQAVFCREAFTGLADLAGRRVRTSSVGQSEMMSALGAVPVMVPFAEIVSALRDGVADCAITGTLSGYEIGLPAVTTHVHAMAISWGLSFFGANDAAWQSLPPDLRDVVRAGVADLEARIWARAAEDTALGLACDTGGACPGPAPARALTLVPISAEDAERRRALLAGSVLPRWIERCGIACATAWNETLAPVLGISAAGD